MSQVLYTRCPYCRTAFRTNPEQLALRNGQVRCGNCRKIFNARGHLVKLEPTPVLARPEYELDEDYDPMKGPQTMTLRRSVTAPEPATPEPVPTSEAPATAAKRDDAERVARASFAWDRLPERHRFGWLYAALLPLLLVALIVQAAHHFRSQLAVQAPALKVPLEAYCERVGCRLEPLREPTSLTIEASDLQADPAHRGFMILSVTLRNRAAYPLAYPQLELTLTDTQGQALVRRVFAPEEYARDPLALASGITAGDEKTVKLFLDGSAVSAEGYKIERFYTR